MSLSVGLGQARWTGIDPEPFAELAKSGAVGRLGRALEHLVHVLVRHFVLQHLEHRAPRMGQDERARHLDRAARWIPLSEARRAVGEAYRRGPQAPLEVARVQILVARAQLAQECRLELRRQPKRAVVLHARP